MPCVCKAQQGRRGHLQVLTHKEQLLSNDLTANDLTSNDLIKLLQGKVYSLEINLKINGNTNFWFRSLQQLSLVLSILRIISLRSNVVMLKYMSLYAPKFES